MIAAHDGHEAVVKRLLEYSPKVDEKNNQNWNALMIAAKEGHEAIVKLLREYDAKVDEKDNQGWDRTHDRGSEWSSSSCAAITR